MEEQELSYSAGGIQNGMTPLEDILVVSYKTKHTLSYDLAISLSHIYPKQLKNLHKNLQKDVYSSFIHNCPNLEATKMTFSGEWMN